MNIGKSEFPGKKNLIALTRLPQLNYSYTYIVVYGKCPQEVLEAALVIAPAHMLQMNWELKSKGRGDLTLVLAVLRQTLMINQTIANPILTDSIPTPSPIHCRNLKAKL